MGKQKQVNCSELIADYDENFVNSLSLNEVHSAKELKELLLELSKANNVVTSFYEMLYNDYMSMINSEDTQLDIDIEVLKRYRGITSKIQKAYNYLLYLTTFENPFKPRTRK